MTWGQLCLILALAAPAAFGAIDNVQLRGVTATQAILSYTAPDTTACTVEVSESAAYVPLSHDVDAALFAGSNLDSRAESYSQGRARVFVVGKRRAEKGSDGRWYSRALQTVTTHYYRIQCGSDLHSGQFVTANIALGNTYNEPFPGDPAVASRPYYSSIGSYAWPEFKSWNNQDPNARPESVIDPQTGMLLKRLALPQDAPVTYLPGTGDHTFDTAISADGAWTLPGASLADDTNSATFSGNGSNWLFVGDNTFASGTPGTFLPDINYPTEYVTVSVKGWCSAGPCAGEDAKIQACLTINNVTCWPTNATAKLQEVTLGTSTNPGFLTLGNTVPILDSWTPPGFAPLNRADMAQRFGKANVDAAGVATWVSSSGSGTYFNANWTNGSRIAIGGSNCTTNSAATLTTLTIDPSSCSPALSLPLSGASFSGGAFGFLIRKKTSSTDRINLQYHKYTTGTSLSMDWPASGSSRQCSSTLTQNSVTGGLGYHCVMLSGWPLLYWVNSGTGDANYLGLFGVPSSSGPDGYAGGLCDGARTMIGTTPTDPESFYCTSTDNETPARRILISCTLTSNNQPGNQSVACANLTPGALGKDIHTLIEQFTSGSAPSFNHNLFSCYLAGSQGTKLILACGRSVQDTIGWTVVFDPKKVGTDPGCVGGGAPGCVVGAMSSWATAPARWCVNHTTFLSGATDQVFIAGKYFGGGTQLGDGPYVSTITAGTLGSTGAIAPGTGSCPAGTLRCDTVTVDGEPCDSTPATGEAAASACPKNSAWVYLQDARVGDIFSIEGEWVILAAKSGNSWTLQRGYGYPGVSAHSGRDLSAYCSSTVFFQGSSEWSWTWDTAKDPHGQNSDGSMVRVAWAYDHPNLRPDATIGFAPWNDPGCTVGPCYAIRSGAGPLAGPPNRHVATGPTFAGASGTSALAERAQPHPSRLQDNAPSHEKSWFTDGRPLTPLMDISDAAMWVSGQLYRLTSTSSDGDNMTRIGNNLYVVKTSSATLVAAGNCSAGNPCSIWSDVQLQDSITHPCTITLNSGSGTVFISRLGSGGLGVTYTAGLSVTSDQCPVASGTGFPPGSMSVWIWTATSGTWDAIGSDVRVGSSGEIGTLNRKLQPTWAYCGTQPLNDGSSSATGDVLSDGASDAYKYCVARKGGECRSGSQRGDIYVNCPNQVRRSRDGAYGCSWFFDNRDTPVDICISNMSAYLNSIAQMGFSHDDFTGALGRSLTKGLSRYKIVDYYWSAQALADAKWIMFRSMYTGGVWTEVLLGKVPPFPPVDTIVRSTFVPIPVRMTPPSGLTVDNAVIQFGYAENGNSSNFYCTSRQEKCLATASTIPAMPFLFPSDGTAGSEAGIGGVPCSTGCTVTLPAISQRMMYYQIKYRDVSNQTVATGQVEVIAVP